MSKYFVWILIGIAISALLYTALDGPIYPDYDQLGSVESGSPNSLSGAK